MMRMLLESAAPGQRRLGSWTSVSVGVHGAIVGAAIWLTVAPPPSGPIRMDPTVLPRWVHPVPEPPPAQRPVAAGRPVPRPGRVDIPPVSIPRITFPDVIPSITSNADFPASRIFGDPNGTSIRPVSDAPFESGQVEQIVRPRVGNPNPVYPATLRSANVEGDVRVRFIVDTLGRVEPRSVEIRETTHALFADAVRDWLRRTRYEPATIGGQPVRQLVEQRVGFTLRR